MDKKGKEKTIILTSRIEEVFSSSTTETKTFNYGSPEADTTEGFIKVGKHIEKQKFGEKPTPQISQISFFDTMECQEDKEKINNDKITIIGVDNTTTQNKALQTIQKILTQTNYKGNTEGIEIDSEDNAFSFKGYVPRIKFNKPSDYLEEYGVKKYKTKRNKLEYGGVERSEALKALRDLSTKNHIIIYSRQTDFKKDKEGKCQSISKVVKVVRPLISIIEGFEGVTDEEINSGNIPDEKLTGLIIQPCVALIDQIDTYYIMKPNVYKDIKEKYHKNTGKLSLFLEYLVSVANDRMTKYQKLDFKIGVDKLTYKLRLEKYIHTRQMTRLKKQLTKYFDQAKELGYLSEYKIKKGVTEEIIEFTLNEDKYYKTEKWKEAQNRNNLKEA